MARMSLEPILVLIVIAVIANLVVMAALVASPVMGRARTGYKGDDRYDVPGERALAAAALSRADDDRAEDGVTARAYDRVVRIASWVFLLATTTIVGVTGLWPQNQAAIFALLALAGLFVLVIHDLLRKSTTWRRPSGVDLESRTAPLAMRNQPSIGSPSTTMVWPGPAATVMPMPVDRSKRSPPTRGAVSCCRSVCSAALKDAAISAPH
jgi:hypothetical protein